MKILNVVLIIVTIGTLVFSFLVEHSEKEKELWWNNIPIFYSLFGFIGCIMLVWVAKVLGKGILQKRDDYYDKF